MASSVPWLTLATFLPAAFALLLLPFKNRTVIKGLALLGSIVTLAVASGAIWAYSGTEADDPSGMAQVLSEEREAIRGGLSAEARRAIGRADGSGALGATAEADRARRALKLGAGETAHAIYDDVVSRGVTAMETLASGGEGQPQDDERAALQARLRQLAENEGTAAEADLVRDALRAKYEARQAEQQIRRLEDAPAAWEAYGELREIELVLATDDDGDRVIPVVDHIRLVEYADWIPGFRIHYLMGVDGLSLPLIWLTALLTVLCVVYSWSVDKVNKIYPKAYFALFLLLETGLIGVFCALDFFLFYVFWEIVLLPMYFLVGIWGGHDRIYAAIKFFIYTLVGSVLMLVAMLAMYFTVDPASFNMLALQNVVPFMSYGFQWWIFVALFIAFAIKVPVFPFHTWLPAAHVEAPTAGSMVLAGILLKMGGYGFFRIMYPLCPEAATATVFIYFIGILGMVNIIYGALVAMAQTDFKKLVAYSSISHMGYVLLGLAALSAAGFAGGVLQMFNHGVSSAMMFALVGILYDHYDPKLRHRRPHHRDLNDYDGIALHMPRYFGWAILGFFASLGLPGLNGFISEALVFLGAYDETSLLTLVDARWIVYLSLSGIVLTAAYLLWTIQRVYLGDKNPDIEYDDLTFQEWVTLAPLGIICLVIGVYPAIILDFMNPTLEAIRRPVVAWFGVGS